MRAGIGSVSQPAEVALSAQGRALLGDSAGADDDLVAASIEILTSLCARLDGR